MNYPAPYIKSAKIEKPWSVSMKQNSINGHGLPPTLKTLKLATQPIHSDMAERNLTVLEAEGRTEGGKRIS